MVTNRQYLIPGIGYINENAPPRQFLIAGMGYVNSTAAIVYSGSMAATVANVTMAGSGTVVSANNYLKTWNGVPIPQPVPTAFSSLTYAATVTPVSNTLNRIIATGNLIIAPPTLARDGDITKFWITASGGNYTVTLDATIVLPTSLGFTNPITVNNGVKASISLQYDSTRAKFELSYYVNGY